jgi:hypothetical protein
MLTADPSRPAELTEGGRESQFPRIEDPAGIEGVLHGGQDVQ